MAVQTYLLATFFLIGTVSGMVIGYIVLSFTEDQMSTSLGLKFHEQDLSVSNSSLMEDLQRREDEYSTTQEWTSHEVPISDKLQEFKDELYHQGMYKCFCIL